MPLSSEIRKRHQFTEATLQNTAEVLQMPEVTLALGGEHVDIYKNILNRYYHPNLQQVSTSIGGTALLASAPDAYKNTDMLPIIANHADEDMYVDADSLQMYRPTQEKIDAFSKAFRQWRGESDDCYQNYVDAFSDPNIYASTYHDKPIVLSADKYAQVLMPRLVLPLDDDFPNKTMDNVLISSRPWTQLNMDFMTVFNTPAMRSHPATVVHEAQHIDDDFILPLFSQGDEQDAMMITEIKAYQVGHKVDVALQNNGYNGNIYDTPDSPEISREIEELRAKLNTADDPYAPSETLRQRIASSQYANAIGI